MRKLKNIELGRKSIDEYKDSLKTPFIVVLDNVRSMSNVGSIFRTADCFLLEGIYLCGITGTPPHRDIQKTALGATESVPWKYFPSTKNAAVELKSKGYQLIGIEQTEGAFPLQDFEIISGKKYALFFGHEVNGVDQEIINICDACIEIPQIGTKHSFNIAVSAGIVMWEFAKEYLKK